MSDSIATVKRSGLFIGAQLWVFALAAAGASCGCASSPVPAQAPAPAKAASQAAEPAPRELELTFQPLLDDAGRAPRSVFRYDFKPGQSAEVRLDTKSRETRPFLRGLPHPPRALRMQLSVETADDAGMLLSLAVPSSEGPLPAGKLPADSIYWSAEVQLTQRGTGFVVHAVEPAPMRQGATLLMSYPPPFVVWPEEAIGPGATWRAKLVRKDTGAIITTRYSYLGQGRGRHVVLARSTLELSEQAVSAAMEKQRKVLEALEQSADVPLPSPSSMTAEFLDVYEVDTKTPCVIRRQEFRAPFEQGRPSSSTLAGTLATCEDVGAVDAILRAQSPERLALIEAYGRVGGPRAIPSLTALLADSDTEVRKAAQVALTNITDHKERSAADLTLLADVLWDDDEQAAALTLLENAASQTKDASTRAAYELYLAKLSLDAQRPEDANRWYERSLASASTLPEVLNAVAWWRATASVDRFRNPQQALTLALQLADSAVPTPAYVQTLAAAYARNGEFERAALLQREATAARRKRGTLTNGEASRWEERLTSYESRKAWVETPSREHLPGE